MQLIFDLLTWLGAFVAVGLLTTGVLAGLDA